MITQFEVTIINIDDYIRQTTKRGKKSIYWDARCSEILRQFKPKITDGDSYLGAKHYLRQ